MQYINNKLTSDLNILQRFTISSMSHGVAQALTVRMLERNVGYIGPAQSEPVYFYSVLYPASNTDPLKIGV